MGMDANMSEPSNTQEALMAALALSKEDEAFSAALEEQMACACSIAEDGSITLSAGDATFVATAEQIMPGAAEESEEGPDGGALDE